MTPQTNDALRGLIDQLFERVINAHCPQRAQAFYREDYVQHNPHVGQGLAGVQQLLTALNRAFPDLRGEIVFGIAQDDRVMVQVEWTGTHLGDFFGLPPTSRAIGFCSAETFRIQDGLIAEHWDVVDNVAMQVTLGLLAPPARPG
jgi:predicted SnoaL-like aldol condensation-catalyzing enzyme